MARGYLLLFALVVVCAAVVDARERSLLDVVCGNGGTYYPGNNRGKKPGGRPGPTCSTGQVLCSTDGSCDSGTCTVKCADGETFTATLNSLTGEITFNNPVPSGTINTIDVKGGSGYCEYTSASPYYTPHNCGKKNNVCGLSHLDFCYTPQCVCTQAKVKAAVDKYFMDHPLPVGSTLVCTAPTPPTKIQVCGKNLVAIKSNPACGEYVKFTYKCPDVSNTDYTVSTTYQIGDKDVIFTTGCPLKAHSYCVTDITPTYGVPTYAPASCTFSVLATATGNCGVFSTKTITCTPP